MTILNEEMQFETHDFIDFVSFLLKRNALPLYASFATFTDTHNFISPPVNIVEFYLQHNNNAFSLTSFPSLSLFPSFLPLSLLPLSFLLFLLLSSFSPSSSSSSLYLFNLFVNASQISQALYNWDELRSFRATRAWRYDIPRKACSRKLPSR